MGIPKTYYDGNPEDREYVNDFWTWLEDQPQQAWLYYARRANWDEAERMFVSMVQHERCDRALASWFFWQSEPRWYLASGKRPTGDKVIGAVLDRCEDGGFPQANLHYQRVEVALHALLAAKALDELSGPAPFKIPSELCASFDGTNADLPCYDAETERDIAELFESLDGELPRTDAQSIAGERDGGNWWYEAALRMPARPMVSAEMSDVEAIDAVFGEHRSTLRKIERRRLRLNRRPGASGLNQDLKQRTLGLGLLAVSGAGLLWLLWRWLAR